MPDAKSTPSIVYRDESLASLQARASQGDTVAVRVLGERYEVGAGVQQDLDKAIMLYRRAAFIRPEQRFLYAPAVGKMSGYVVPYTIGNANANDPIALVDLGRLYERGLGVAHDPDRAARLFSCALARGADAAALSATPSPNSALHEHDRLAE